MELNKLETRYAVITSKPVDFDKYWGKPQPWQNFDTWGKGYLGLKISSNHYWVEGIFEHNICNNTCNYAITLFNSKKSAETAIKNAKKQFESQLTQKQNGITYAQCLEILNSCIVVEVIIETKFNMKGE